jgi:hypothetical protein
MKKQGLNGEIGCVVPVHHELKVGTLSPEEFIENL